jgi:hypothetical protein
MGIIRPGMGNFVTGIVKSHTPGSSLERPNRYRSTVLGPLGLDNGFCLERPGSSLERPNRYRRTVLGLLGLDNGFCLSGPARPLRLIVRVISGLPSARLSPEGSRLLSYLCMCT